VQARSAIPIERLRVVSRFDDLHLPQIRRGIVFVLAAWSGPAVLGLRKFTEAIVEHVTDSLDLVVIDIDCLSQEAIAALFGSSGFPVGGNGETAWVKDGVVVDREIAASCASSTILENTKSLQNEEAA